MGEKRYEHYLYFPYGARIVGNDRLGYIVYSYLFTNGRRIRFEIRMTLSRSILYVAFEGEGGGIHFCYTYHRHLYADHLGERLKRRISKATVFVFRFVRDRVPNL